MPLGIGNPPRALTCAARRCPPPPPPAAAAAEEARPPPPPPTAPAAAAAAAAGSLESSAPATAAPARWTLTTRARLLDRIHGPGRPGPGRCGWLAAAAAASRRSARRPRRRPSPLPPAAPCRRRRRPLRRRCHSQALRSLRPPPSAERPRSRQRERAIHWLPAAVSAALPPSPPPAAATAPWRLLLRSLRRQCPRPVAANQAGAATRTDKAATRTSRRLRCGGRPLGRHWRAAAALGMPGVRLQCGTRMELRATTPRWAACGHSDGRRRPPSHHRLDRT